MGTVIQNETDEPYDICIVVSNQGRNVEWNWYRIPPNEDVATGWGAWYDAEITWFVVLDMDHNAKEGITSKGDVRTWKSSAFVPRTRGMLLGSDAVPDMQKDNWKRFRRAVPGTDEYPALKVESFIERMSRQSGAVTRATLVMRRDGSVELHMRYRSSGEYTQFPTIEFHLGRWGDG